MDRLHVKGSTKNPAISDAATGNSKPMPQTIADQLSNARYSPDEIRTRQRRIHDEVLQLSRTMDGANFSRVDGDDLRRMTMLYDREFFDSSLLAMIGRDRLRFGFSSRMTRVAGKLVTHFPVRRRRWFPWSESKTDERRFEMTLSSTLLFQAFHDVDRPIEVTGVRCANRLEAMQRVCEHELVHLLEMFLWNDSSCIASRFQSIANRFFAHTEHRHDLITQTERAAKNFDIRVGSIVKFSYDGNPMVGWVNRITRRATVLVEDSQGERFNDGRRYSRFYVPLEQLQLVQAKAKVGQMPG